MTDQELDRALAQAIEVEPRPDFLARVRAEVAREPVPSPWPWPGWWHVAAAGAVVAGLAAVVGMPRPADDAEAPPADSRAAAADSRPAIGTMASTVTPETAEARVTPRAAEPMPSRRRAALPRVVPVAAAAVGSIDTDLLWLMIEAAQDGLLTPADEPAEALALSPLDVPPIHVEPLAALTPVDAGERQ